MLHGGKLNREFYQSWANYYTKFQERILSPFSFNTRDHAVFTGVPPVKAS